MDRARAAAILLRGGASSADVVNELGFYDYSHLHRSLRRYIGRTATQLSARDGLPLSLLYMTE